jgi:prepilin-type N-terminal cleavage/methylation domain-containing protein
MSQPFLSIRQGKSPYSDMRNPFQQSSGLARRAAGSERGFSLIELMVAVALFAVITMVAVGALLALVDATRKARALESIMNNLNVTLDSMVRSIRMGTEFSCASESAPDDVLGGNCPEGDMSFSFSPFGADPDAQNERWVYSFADGRLYRSKDGGSNSVEITAPEVTIEELRFYVVGTVRRDTTQPKVVIVVKGTAGSSERTQSTFYIQATAVQRALDL